MAISAFGDDLDEDPVQVPGLAAPQPQAAPAPSLSAFGDSLDDPDQATMPNRTAGQWATDIGGSLGRGAYNLFDAAAGLGDIATGGAVTPWLAKHGLDSKAARADLDAEMSPQARAQQQEVAGAQGFLPTVGAMLRNPAFMASQILESVPTMVAGGVAGKGVGLGARALGMTAPAAGLVGAGTGEGLAAAGQQAANTVQQTGDLTLGQTAAALGSGALTGLIGAGSAGLAGRLGSSDLDAILSGAAAPQVGRGMFGRLGVGAGLETGEESLQSAQEQVAQNLALGNPLGQGVGNAAGQGAVLGAAMGGAAGLRRPGTTTPQPAQQAQGMAIPGPTPSASPAQPQQAPAPAEQLPQPVPFARSADLSPLLDNLGVQGAQRDDTLALLQPVESEVDAKRRGMLPMTEQKRLASLIGLQGESADVFARKIGQAHNAEQIMAMTNGVSDQLKSVLEHQQKIASGQASDLDRASFVQQIADLRANFGDLMGARAESGRALAAQRRTVSDFKQAQAILEGIGGVQGADDLATALGAAVKAGGVGNASRLISKPETTMQRLLGYYFRSALLSGVRTHAVNITSNTLTLGNEMIERSLAAGIGGAKRLATGGKAGQTLFAEPLDLLIGMAKGSAKAGTAALDAFKTGESAVLGGQAKQDNALGLNNSPRKPGTLNALAYGADKLASIPYRALGAEDALFATLNFEGELRTLARQQAVAERKTGALPKDVKLSQRIEQIVQDPTAQMIEAAGEHARVQTFNQKAGTFAQAVMSAKAKAPWLNLIAPFIRTPANIVKFGLKRTPLAPFFKDVRADFAAGGARQERAAARILWGSSIMIGAGALAQAGYISGAGPDDKKEREALEATGWRPYSIRVGDTWHEYNRLDPFSQWLGLAADMSTMDYQDKNGADVAANVLGSLVNNTINKTYMQGVSNFVEFLQDPKRNGEWYLRQMGGTLAQPLTLLSNIASEQDPYARAPDSVLDQIKYRLPGLRNDLPTKLDRFGEPVPNRSYPGGPLSLAAPIAQSEQSQAPFVLEAGRLGWAPPAFQKALTLKGKQTQFTAEQHHELVQLAGQLTRQGAERLMKSPTWKNLDDDQRRDALDTLAKKARTAVRLAAIPYISTGKRDALDRLRATLQQPQRGEQ
ncbi:hypothetical protein [Pseudomonas sp. JUb96]|uniref:hypothetical protein n=1 Tax=Pseudomonas sp. JUb96 TaxID=2940539 RepID=UPI002225BF4E|nr:hypothetical protein [Pseudomonas sp. JUb96]MCW2267594.1 hypothetical protein [Pseudomonas sp. JUb96]